MTTETQTFQAPVFTAQGKQGGTRQLPEGMFDGTVNVPVMHQAVAVKAAIDALDAGFQEPGDPNS